MFQGGLAHSIRNFEISNSADMVAGCEPADQRASSKAIKSLRSFKGISVSSGETETIIAWSREIGHKRKIFILECDV
jgi:hypothetical protein